MHTICSNHTGEKYQRQPGIVAAKLTETCTNVYTEMIIKLNSFFARMANVKGIVPSLAVHGHLILYVICSNFCELQCNTPPVCAVHCAFVVLIMLIFIQLYTRQESSFQWEFQMRK